MITDHGVEMEGFTELKPEQSYEVEIEDGQYGKKYKLKTNKPFSAKAFTPNYRLEAMKLATQLSCYNIVKADQLFPTADKILEYLNKK